MASLEGLPAELRFLIIDNVDDIHTLQCLVRASPVYHMTYRGSRKAILLELVKRQHHERSLVEPLFAVRSIAYSLWSTKSNKSVDMFLDTYGKACSCAYTPTSADYDAKYHLHAHLRELMKLVKLQRAVMRIVDDFSASKLGNGSSKLDPMETRRVTRALYRLQMLCNLFGYEDQGTHTRGDGRFRSHLPSRVFTRFLSRFPPWEVQEMGCVWQHIVSRYGEIIQDLNVDDDWRERFAYPTWERQASLEPIEDNCSAEAACMASLGPWHFAGILSERDPLIRRYTIEQDIPRFRLTFYAIYAAAELPTVHKAPADKYNGTGRVDNSFLQQLPEIEQPTPNWVRLCQKHRMPSLGVWPEAATVNRRTGKNVLRKAKEEWDTGFAIWDEEPAVRVLNAMLTRDGPSLDA